MAVDDSKPASPALSPPPAWQPLTPRGVAAFAQATLGRLLLVELVIASLTAGAVIWFLDANWFPTIRQAIHQLPQQGEIRNQRLELPLAPATTLAETRPYLILVLNLEKQRNASQTSDVLIEFHRNNFQICSLFGCLLLSYPQRWTVEFNRPRLAPWWEAWEPILLGLAGLLVVAVQLVSWALLATFYCGLVRVLGFFKDRDLNWGRSWRLASAALLPGTLLLPAAIFCYGLGVVDLLRLLLLFVLHLAVSWIYLVVSPVLVPRLPAVLPPGVNPFAAPPARPKGD